MEVVEVREKVVGLGGGGGEGWEVHGGAEKEERPSMKPKVYLFIYFQDSIIAHSVSLWRGADMKQISQSIKNLG